MKLLSTMFFINHDYFGSRLKLIPVKPTEKAAYFLEKRTEDDKEFFPVSLRPFIKLFNLTYQGHDLIKIVVCGPKKDF